MIRSYSGPLYLFLASQIHRSINSFLVGCTINTLGRSSMHFFWLEAFSFLLTPYPCIASKGLVWTEKNNDLLRVNTAWVMISPYQISRLYGNGIICVQDFKLKNQRDYMCHMINKYFEPLPIITCLFFVGILISTTIVPYILFSLSFLYCLGWLVLFTF